MEKKVEKTTSKAANKVAEKTKLTLADQIKHFNRMAQLARVRARFIDTKDQLKELEFNHVTSINNFENNDSLKLVLKEGYNNEILSISNDFILSEFRSFLLERIEGKIKEIDVELLK